MGTPIENERATEVTPPVAPAEWVSTPPSASRQYTRSTFTPYTPVGTDVLAALREAEGYVVCDIVGDCGEVAS